MKKEIIKVFMEIAKKELELVSGLNRDVQSAKALIWCWISFDSFCSQKYQKNHVNERIEDFSKDFQGDYEKEYSSLPDRIEENLKLLKDKEIKDLRPNSRNLPIKITDFKDLGNILKVIYQVRNNLLHGAINITERQEQEILIHSSIVLYYILEWVLGKEK